MNFNRSLILASSSPRRQYLLKEAGFEFSVESPDVDESFPEDMAIEDIPVFLARKKAEVFRAKISEEIVIAADTVVLLGNKVLNKPANHAEAVTMLESLSGRTHRVITGVCLLGSQKTVTFDDRTDVTFRSLTRQEIEYYIKKCQPFDKAGAYGAQDWIGLTAITEIRGSYFTVMGLPVHKVYEHLINF